MIGRLIAFLNWLVWDRRRRFVVVTPSGDWFGDAWKINPSGGLTIFRKGKRNMVVTSYDVIQAIIDWDAPLTLESFTELAQAETIDNNIRLQEILRLQAEMQKQAAEAKNRITTGGGDVACQ